MSSERKKIRHAIVDLLKRKKTSAGRKVFGNRSTNVWQEDLPAIMVYPRSEDVSERSKSPREITRSLSMAIEIVTDGKDDDEAADRMDDLADQVERILGVDETLGCTTDDIILDSVEFDYEDKGERSIMSATLVYLLTYVVNVPKDRRDQDTDDFTNINASWDVGTASDPDPEATDTINLPQ